MSRPYLFKLPSGSRALARFTGQGYRVVIVDRKGDITHKHFAHFKEEGKAASLASKIRQVIDLNHWFDGEGKKFPGGSFSSWQYAPEELWILQTT